jgi:hypothetical protein
MAMRLEFRRDPMMSYLEGVSERRPNMGRVVVMATVLLNEGDH